MSQWQTNQGTSVARNSAGLPIGPMTVSDVLDGCVKLVKCNWKQLLALSVLMAIPGILANFAQYASGSAPGAMIGDFVRGSTQAIENQSTTDQFSRLFENGVALGLLGVAVALSILLMPYLYGAMVRVLSGSYMGKEASLKTVLSQTGSRYPALLLATILVILAVIGSVVPVLVPVGILAAAFPPAILLVALAIIPVLVVGTMLMFIYNVVVFEETSGAASLGRSWSLVSKRFFPILGIVVLVWLLATIVGAIVAMPLTILSIGLGALWAPLEYPLTAITNIVSTFVGTSISVAAVTLLYFDSRIRLEGFDLALRSSQDKSHDNSAVGGTTE